MYILPDDLMGSILFALSVDTYKNNNFRGQIISRWRIMAISRLYAEDDCTIVN